MDGATEATRQRHAAQGILGQNDERGRQARDNEQLIKSDESATWGVPDGMRQRRQTIGRGRCGEKGSTRESRYLQAFLALARHFRY